MGDSAVNYRVAVDFFNALKGARYAGNDFGVSYSHFLVALALYLLQLPKREKQCSLDLETVLPRYLHLFHCYNGLDSVGGFRIISGADNGRRLIGLVPL